MEVPNDPLIAFFQLPQDVQNWYEKLMVETADTVEPISLIDELVTGSIGPVPGELTQLNQ